MKLKRLKASRKQGDSVERTSINRAGERDTGSRRGCDSARDVGGDGGGSVENQRSAASAHRPKIRVPGDAPRKIKIMASSLSSKQMARADSKDQTASSYHTSNT